jgi:hypothetical protein
MRHTTLGQIRKRLSADLKPFLIDLEARSRATGRKRNGSVRD